MGFQSNDSFFTTNVTVLRSSDDIVANNLWVFNQMNLFSPPMPRFWGVLIIYLLIIFGLSIRGSIFRGILSKGMQKSYQMTLFSSPMPRFWGVLMRYLLIQGMEVWCWQSLLDQMASFWLHCTLWSPNIISLKISNQKLNLKIRWRFRFSPTLAKPFWVF